jgi:hypothetical protein
MIAGEIGNEGEIKVSKMTRHTGHMGHWCHRTATIVSLWSHEAKRLTLYSLLGATSSLQGAFTKVLFMVETAPQ